MIRYAQYIRDPHGNIHSSWLCLLAALLSMALLPQKASAQSVEEATTTDSVGRVETTLYFRRGESRLDLLYHNNKQTLDDFVQRYKNLYNDTSLILSPIRIIGTASPDGSYQANQRLALRRAHNLSDHLRSSLALTDSQLAVGSVGIHWEGLLAAIDTLPDMPYREEARDIILNVPELGYVKGLKIELRKQRLIHLHEGKTWKYLYKKVFSDLRSSNTRLAVNYQLKSKPLDPSMQELPPMPNIEDVAEDVAGDALVADSTLLNLLDEEALDTTLLTPHSSLLTPSDSLLTPHSSLPTPRYPILALRTNLLLPLLNVGVEVPLGEHWSVGADYYYPWLWRKADHKNCFQLTVFSAEARYWFGKHRTKEHRLTGHSVGVYGAWGYYDFEHNWSGHQGEGWSLGADYLYALPIAKGKLHLEFQLAVGYMQSKARPYDVFYEGGHLIRRPNVYKKYRYFGPTKLGVSLVLPLTKKLLNASSAKEGGEK